ncbi:hypothetical protein QUF74_05775 [Candidatus Halobeggiatoa sp. HSG11]|nr:hypothetical protein [Candidatus Halobeggiatoa sp. HSG11]
MQYVKFKINPIYSLLDSIKNFLAGLGFLLLAGLMCLYFYGYQVSDSFNNEFASFFGKFVKQVLKKDVASAMVIKIELKSGVTIKQASSAMKNYANKINVELVNTYSPYKEDHRFVKIFEFSKVGITSLLIHNPDFAAYLPYRIIMYEDNNKQIWIAVLDVGSLLQGNKNIDPDVKMQVLKIQESLLKIMNFGAYGIEN